ncbi:MAG: hypothetical protein A2171_02895 [Candidatus Levybacteria bacterium RBG_13_35_9]|nr:MAG: hypothetical protein A2171_02895 [Candidatus Levybacteria bacterium RBG_13_35_9]
MARKEKSIQSENFWKSQLVFPDWYIRLEDYLRETIFPIVHDDPKLKAERHRFYGLVEEMLKNREIPFADSGPDLDSERQPINTIIVHHTEEDSSITLGRLNAIGLIRQYGQKYLEDDVYGHKGLKGKPVWSGHFRNGQMVFFSYHWLIRTDEKTERLLDDKYIARHAVQNNPNSVGIALSGDYEHSTPPIQQIETTAKTIRENYPFVEISNIFGHLEVMQGRTCPGDKFLGGWKNTLIELVSK